LFSTMDSRLAAILQWSKFHHLIISFDGSAVDPMFGFLVW
jgi:hypothetical protein